MSIKSTTIKAEYFAETTDDKSSGTIIVRAADVVAVYNLPGYSKRTMLLTDQGLKFCVKGKPADFMAVDELLQESN